MCLCWIDKTHKDPLPDEVLVYKVARIRRDINGKTVWESGPYFPEYVAPDVWHRCLFTGKIDSNRGGLYDAGFHCYPDEKSAEQTVRVLNQIRADDRRLYGDWVIVPCLASEIVAEGSEWGPNFEAQKVLVARRIRFPRVEGDIPWMKPSDGTTREATPIPQGTTSGSSTASESPTPS